ncbi:hypothetical protein R6V09_39540 [Streptomyces sp. W16]|uniref:hypothetical protein n=1 Tax=Streptomyces sp. W16 TaxID=3076631 RepID=UPI00295BAABD|nr:hypothetical protein [Streptomyces sp. W16]MDV9176205.1 hypothetical protein [Streptomyces sp. W16]
MKRTSGIRLCVTVAVGALSLALITGCSDGGSDSAKSNATNDAKDSGTTSSAKALSAAELKKLILAQGDVDGYKVAAVTESVPGGRAGIKADAKCKPLLYVMSGLAPTDAPAETNRMATANKKPAATASADLENMSDADIEKALTDSMSVDVTVVALSSYDGDGAQKAVKAVSDAVAGCTGGFTAKAGGEEQKFTRITAEKGSGTGDESVAYAAYGEVDEADGKSSVVHAEVVRHGNVLATYYTMNLGAMVAGKAYTVPAAVVTAQSAKLK